MTHSRTWKKREQNIAEFFGTQRTSLSGGNSKITASDSMHESLFIEAKLRKNHTAVLFWEVAKRKTKKGIPIAGLRLNDSDDHLLIIYSDHLKHIPNCFTVAETFTRNSHESITLYNKTKELAAKENKIPMLALCMKNRPGFWILCHPDHVMTLREVVRSVRLV